LVLLQLRRGKWRKSREESPGWWCITVRRFGPSEPATKTGVLPISIRLRFRDVTKVDVSKFFDRQREVSGILIMFCVCECCCCSTTSELQSTDFVITSDRHVRNKGVMVAGPSDFRYVFGRPRNAWHVTYLVNNPWSKSV